jgi:deoxycytidylate deaminase
VQLPQMRTLKIVKVRKRVNQTVTLLSLAQAHSKCLVYVTFHPCTVCIKVLEQVDASLAPADKKNKDKIEAAIEKFCSQKLGAKEDKMCYYLKPIKKHISQPFSLGMPKLK